MLPKIQFISQGLTPNDHIRSIEKVLDAGVTWIQFRLKDHTEDEVCQWAEEVKKLTNPYKAKLIVNDYPGVAKRIDADGVHLGLLDADIKTARKILGDKIIGGTANTLEDIQRRVTEGADYIGLGPFRYTKTKKKLSPILGLEGYHKIFSRLYVKVPVYAIGGIYIDDVPELMTTGIHGIAVSGMLSNSDILKKTVMELNKRMNHYVDNCR